MDEVQAENTDTLRELLELERAREARRRRRNRVLAWSLPAVLVAGLVGWGVAEVRADDARERCLAGQMYADMAGVEPVDC